MRDIITLEKSKVNITATDVTINVSLLIPEVANMFKAYSEEEALKYITYVALTNSYKSDLITRGLTGKELHEAACIKCNLPFDFIISDEIKELYKAYKTHYNNGLPGLIKEIYKTFEITRNSTALINNILNKTQELLAQQAKNSNATKELSSISGMIKDIIDNIKYVRGIANSLDDDISKLKDIEIKLGAKEKSKFTVQGNGTVPKTALRTELREE